MLRMVQDIMGHFVGDGKGQFFPAIGKSDQTKIDGQDIIAKGISVYRRASVKQEEGVDRDELTVGVCDLVDDIGDIGIGFAIMDVVVAGDGGKGEEIGTGVVDLLIVSFGRLFGFEGARGRPRLFSASLFVFGNTGATDPGNCTGFGLVSHHVGNTDENRLSRRVENKEVFSSVVIWKACLLKGLN